MLEENKPYEIVKGSDPFTILPQQTCCLKSDVFPIGSPPGGKFTNSGRTTSAFFPLNYFEPLGQKFRLGISLFSSLLDYSKKGEMS